MNVLTSGVPKPSLKPQSTQTIRTRPKVVNTIITVFIAHFFWTRPPYRTARAGMDISPTSVAAVICQALSPALSQLGYGFTMPPWANRPAGSNVPAGSTRPLRIPARHMSHARVSRVFPGCYTARNERGGRYLEMSRTIAGPGKTITERRMMIDTVAWVHLENGRILCARPRGKGVFYVPGGKREGAESDLQTLLREIAEE